MVRTKCALFSETQCSYYGNLMRKNIPKQHEALRGFFIIAVLHVLSSFKQKRQKKVGVYSC